MDYCIVTFISGNHAIMVCNRLKEKGINAEIMNTPCSVAKDGCSYCIKVPVDQVDLVVREARENRVAVRDIYRRVIINGKKRYRKLTGNSL